MDKSLNQFLSQRSRESLAALIQHGGTERPSVLLACAPCDRGVQLNGGRLGARWAPKALLAALQKLAIPPQMDDLVMRVETSPAAVTEAATLEEAQCAEASWLANLRQSTPLLHLGGGHDHVLPLLQALGDVPVCVLNVDAHLDTRVDDWAHSGNPFRRFATHKGASFQLLQIGVHPFANTRSTMTPLPNDARMDIVSRDQCEDLAWLQAQLQSLEARLESNAVVVFSLDCDALSGADVRAVSAPNHRGLSIEYVRRLVSAYRDLCHRRGQPPVFGIYEFNPLFDDCSAAGARVIAGLMYQMIFGV